MTMTAEAIAATVFAQIAQRLQAVVAREGGEIVHVKPHGALYNVAVKNAEVALLAIAEGVARWNARVEIFGLAGSPMLDVWRADGLWVARRGVRRPSLRAGWNAALAASTRTRDHRPGSGGDAGAALCAGGRGGDDLRAWGYTRLGGNTF